MSTVSISLPKEQLQFIDKLVSAYGFANRSELIRAILRLLRSRAYLTESAATFPFAVSNEKSRTKILTEFAKTGRYSEAFLKDLEEGLRSSDFFTK